MARSGQALALWTPRVLGVLVALFISTFALDSRGDGGTAFLIHLAPGLVLLSVVGLAWRWECVGAAAFIGLSILYAVIAGPHWQWVSVISGPLLLVGGLYLVSWRWRSTTAPS